MSKHKGADQRGKGAQQQQGQSAQQNRDRKPHEGGAQGGQNDRQHGGQHGGQDMRKPGEQR